MLILACAGTPGWPRTLGFTTTPPSVLAALSAGRSANFRRPFPWATRAYGHPGGMTPVRRSSSSPRSRGPRHLATAETMQARMPPFASALAPPLQTRAITGSRRIPRHGRFRGERTIRMGADCPAPDGAWPLASARPDIGPLAAGTDKWISIGIARRPGRIWPIHWMRIHCQEVRECRSK